MDSQMKRARDCKSLVKVSAQPNTSDQSRCLIGGLPNEMLRAILSRVQLSHLARFRLVNKKWNFVIEHICRDKKCLVVVNYKNYLSTLPNRLNGHFKLSHDFVFIRPIRTTHTSANLCPILAHLFPQIEKFFTDEDFSYSPEFISMLQQWSSKLTTLSLPNQILVNLYTQINNLPNLKQLHLDKFDREIAHQLAPTLNRLEHLSFRDYDSITNIIPLLEIRLTSLGLPSLTIEEVNQWRNVNAQFVSSLERLSFFTVDPQILTFICSHFSSLKMLRIDSIIKSSSNVGPFKFTPDTIDHLARLTHLTELQFNSIVIDLASFDLANLRPLANIRILSLVNFAFVQRNYDARHFGRILSTIFPNVNKLAIKSCFYKMLEDSLESHVNLFTRLRSYDFGLGDSLDRLMEYV